MSSDKKYQATRWLLTWICGLGLALGPAAALAQTRPALVEPLDQPTAEPLQPLPVPLMDSAMTDGQFAPVMTGPASGEMTLSSSAWLSAEAAESSVLPSSVLPSSVLPSSVLPSNLASSNPLEIVNPVVGASGVGVAIPDFPSQGYAPRPGGPSGREPFSTMFSSSPPKTDPWTEQTYERVLDLVEDGNQRELIERVREVVRTTEVGEDTTTQEWVTVKNDGKSITWGGRVEGDYINWLQDDELTDQPSYFEFRRLRLWASGEGYGVYDYGLELDFTPDFTGDTNNLGTNPAVTLQDAYLGMRDLPWLGYLVFGNMRVPMGLSNQTSTRFETFMERPLINRLLPGRQVGVAAFNRSTIYDTTWSYGVFFHDLDQTDERFTDDNQGIRVLGRGTWLPYYDEATQGRCVFHTGLGYSYNRPRTQDNPNLFGTTYRPVRFSARPEINNGDRLINTNFLDLDNYHVLNAELAWVNGPVSVQSELTWAGLEPATRETASLYGAYVQGSYFLTGENRRYDRNFAVFRRVTPHENFWVVRTPRGTESGWGAWEVAFRWSMLNFEDVNDQSLHDLTTGINWHWNPHTRVMMNWIHPIAHNSPVGTQVDSQGDLLALRMQLDF